MNRAETAKIIAVIKASYPSFGGDNLQTTIDVWQMVLEDIPYEQASAAAMAYIRSEHYPPVPADLISLISKVQAKEYPTVAELWGIIRKAISNGIYGYSQEYKALPPICKRAVGRAEQLREWAVLGEELDTVVASNVQRTLERLLQEQKDIDKIPPQIQNAMLGDKLGYMAATLLGTPKDNVKRGME